MEDELTLDRIDTQSEFNLVDICSDDKENSDSPYTTISNSCNYYEPVEVQGLTNSNSLSLFSLNCQGLKSGMNSGILLKTLLREMACSTS